MVDDINVYIYPNTPDDDDLASDALDALDSATSQTMDYFVENGEDVGRFVNVREGYPDVVTDNPVGPPDNTYTQSKGAILQDFGVWRRNNGRQQTGAHLLVTDIPKNQGGLARAQFGGAWRNPPMAVATPTPSRGTQYFKSLCIHESYHLFIQTGFLNAGSDHKFGHVNPNTGKQTPMINGYLGKGPDTAGDCNNTSNNAPYSLQLSDCALDAALKSYQNQGDVF